ncbi:MAG: hypothetical protein E7309_06105 [Butyrivibrio sp.]|nr:hypothetical protein [Butyrivibrio sp.]
MMLANKVVNEDDFKYYMQDAEKNYFGARYCYRELLNNEMVPFKFKTIIERYIKHETDEETTLESHLYYMTREESNYRVYKQLRARVRVFQFKKNKTDVYMEKLYPIDKLVQMTPQEKEEAGMIIRELVISKLALFAFVV